MTEREVLEQLVKGVPLVRGAGGVDPWPLQIQAELARKLPEDFPPRLHGVPFETIPGPRDRRPGGAGFCPLPGCARSWGFWELPGRPRTERTGLWIWYPASPGRRTWGGSSRTWRRLRGSWPTWTWTGNGDRGGSPGGQTGPGVEETPDRVISEGRGGTPPLLFRSEIDK